MSYKKRKYRRSKEVYETKDPFVPTHNIFMLYHKATDTFLISGINDTYTTTQTIRGMKIIRTRANNQTNGGWEIYKVGILEKVVDNSK